MSDLREVSWQLSSLGDAIVALARQSGLAPRAVEVPAPSEDFASGSVGSIAHWIEAAAEWLCIEAEPVEATYAASKEFVLDSGPALLRLPNDIEPRFLTLLGGSRRKILILAPDRTIHRVHPEALRSALCRELETSAEADVDQLLRQAGVPPRHAARTRAALLTEQLGQARITGCWLLRQPPGASFWRQIRQANLLRHLLALLVSYTLQYCLLVGSWWVLGQGVLAGRLDRTWLWAWVLLLVSTVPLRLLATRSQGRFVLGAGGLLKRRLLNGALRMEPEEVKHQGAGQMLGRVIESSALESMALNGSFLSLVALIELAVTGVVLSAGAGGLLHPALLAGWVILGVVIAAWYYRRRGRWTETRLAMTNELVERMVGHRTRLAQEPRGLWHEGEDQAAERYLEQSRTMDRSMTILTLIPRGWLVLGLAGLAPAFIYGQASPTALAVSIGGILLASLALEKLGDGCSSLLSAAIAWKQVAQLFKAAGRTEEIGAPDYATESWNGEKLSNDGQTLIEGHDLSFRYRDQGEPVLRRCSLRICAGDRVLLEGNSGGGKSTLASLLTRLRTPESGLLLQGGLDQQTIGAAAWRRKVVCAPQYHDNHVLTASFAFNLLMGRAWPPQDEDLEEAEAVCRELGLGELLDRMPAGLQQAVGETGWQLSHGERSRLFLARALLQRAELVILDESFAALDPETLDRCLRCALRRAGTLMVIAHP